jgi:hypothetical protein
MLVLFVLFLLYCYHNYLSFCFILLNGIIRYGIASLSSIFSTSLSL